jgi:hypothetical protein
MRDAYATTQAIAVCRQADTQPRHASLGNLIEEISGDLAKFTRDYSMGLWNGPRHLVVERGQHWPRRFGRLVVR